MMQVRRTRCQLALEALFFAEKTLLIFKQNKFSALYLSLFLALWPIFAAAANNLPPRYASGDHEHFWVWDLSVMPPGFRRVEAQAVAVGNRSYIFVEASLLSRVPQFILDETVRRLEVSGLPASLNANLGVIPQNEAIFGPLPDRIRADSRLVVLFADLGSFNGKSFDGFFNVFDQMSETDAWQNHAQHSNEVNIIYLQLPSPPDFLDPHLATSLISHEMEHLLAYGQRPLNAALQESWLEEVCAEGAMLFNGYFTDQGAVDRWANNVANIPLVTTSYVNYGLSILFAAFLIDRAPPYGGLHLVPSSPLGGRENLESIILQQTGVPTSFDRLYNEFISYSYDASLTQEALPGSWLHLQGKGLKVPTIRPVDEIRSLPYSYSGQIYPYSFALFTLPMDLPPNAEITLREEDPSLGRLCPSGRQLFWKPLSGALAVYAAGCPSMGISDKVTFRISIEERQI